MSVRHFGFFLFFHLFKGQDALCRFKATYKQAIKLYCPRRYFSCDILLGISSLPLGVYCFYPQGHNAEVLGVGE